MNMALAEWEASNAYVKPKDVETAMQILADAGYNSKNWQCLTSGYEVYWDSKENKMVLYNSATAEIEYPDEYIGTKDINVDAVNGRWQVYNGNYEQAFKYDFSFRSSSGSNTISGYSLASADTSTNASAAALTAALGGATSDTIKSSIGVDTGTIYVNASSTQYSSTYNANNAAASSYAKIDSYYISNNQDVQLDNNGTLKANTYIVSVVADSAGLVSTEAKQAAGEYVYSLFVQMNVGAASPDATIIIPEGTTIDVSKHEWKAADTYTGYFGASDTDGDGTVTPIVIDGARLTSATGHALTYKMAGSSSKYCCTGFFGAVYGNTTIENVIFKNLTIEGPGADFVIAKEQNNRNCVGVIGAIIPDPSNRNADVNVTIRNVKVENTNIKGIGSVGGLIGYIGAEQGYSYMHGNILIENCTIESNVESSDNYYVYNGYSPVGGIIGFTCRTALENNITVKNTTFSGTVKGYGQNAQLIGNLINSNLVVENCTFTGTCTSLGLCAKDGKDYSKIALLVGRTQSIGAAVTVDKATLTNSGANDNTILVLKQSNDYGGYAAIKDGSTIKYLTNSGKYGDATTEANVVYFNVSSYDELSNEFSKKYVVLVYQYTDSNGKTQTQKTLSTDSVSSGESAKITKKTVNKTGWKYEMSKGAGKQAVIINIIPEAGYEYNGTVYTINFND